MYQNACLFHIAVAVRLDRFVYGHGPHTRCEVGVEALMGNINGVPEVKCFDNTVTQHCAIHVAGQVV